MSLPIGEVARRSGLSHDTLRFYEREGIVPAPDRDLGGRRRYAEGVLDLLEVVTSLRGAGFSLAQVRTVLGVKVPGTSAKERVTAMRAVLADLEADLAIKRQDLDRAAAALAAVHADLDAGEPYADDPLSC